MKVFAARATSNGVLILFAAFLLLSTLAPRESLSQGSMQFPPIDAVGNASLSEGPTSGEGARTDITVADRDLVLPKFSSSHS